MSDLFVNEKTNDIVIVDGDLLLTSDLGFLETMRQRIKATLNTVLGEYFLDDQVNPVVGVPYYQKLLSSSIPTNKLADNIFRTALLTVPNVTSVDELSFVVNTVQRLLIVNFKCKVTEGSETNTIQDSVDVSAIQL